MADITFTGWVEEVLSKDGETFALKTVETHRRKQPDGSYKTTARTFRDVKAGRGSGVSLVGYQKNDRIVVTGREVTEARNNNGKPFYSLVVWAEHLAPLDKTAYQDSEPF